MRETGRAGISKSTPIPYPLASIALESGALGAELFIMRVGRRKGLWREPSQHH